MEPHHFYVDPNNTITASAAVAVLVVCALCLGALAAIITPFVKGNRHQGATALLGACLVTLIGYLLIGWPWGAAIGFAAGSVWRTVIQGCKQAINLAARLLGRKGAAVFKTPKKGEDEP